MIDRLGMGRRHRREEGEEGNEREESGEEHGADVVGGSGTSSAMCDEMGGLKIHGGSVGRRVGGFEKYRRSRPLPLSGEEWGWSRRAGL